MKRGITVAVILALMIWLCTAVHLRRRKALEIETARTSNILRIGVYAANRYMNDKGEIPREFSDLLDFMSSNDWHEPAVALANHTYQDSLPFALAGIDVWGTKLIIDPRPQDGIVCICSAGSDRTYETSDDICSTFWYLRGHQGKGKDVHDNGTSTPESD